MHKWKNRFLAFILATVLAFSAVPSALASEITVFNTSNLAEENIQIAFEGSNIIFKDFPDRDDFKYVMLSLYGTDGRTYLKDVYSTDSDIKMSVSSVEDGMYHIQIYKSQSEYSTYWSYMYGEKGIKVTVQNGIVTYVESPVYEHNKKMYNSNVTNKVLFDCYLEPSVGIESEDKNIVKLAKSIV